MHLWRSNVLLTLSLLACWCTARAEIPTREQRLEESGLNPEYCTWRAFRIRARPRAVVPKGGEPIKVCMRLDFDLSAEVREAEICLIPWRDPYRVLANGRVVARPHLENRSDRGLRRVDLTSALRQGRNTLAVEVIARREPLFILQGIVFCRDGSVHRLATSREWTCGQDLPEGWYEPDADVSALTRAEVMYGRPFSWTPGISYLNPPYFGRLDIAAEGQRLPIFDREKPVRLGVTVKNAAGAVKGGGAAAAAESLQLSYTVLDEHSREQVGGGEVELSVLDDLDLAGTVSAGSLENGAYRFRFVLVSGEEEIDRRDVEVAVVGPIPQREVEGTHYEQGMELREVWSVDCTAEPDPERFEARHVRAKKGTDPTVETRVVQGPAGRYREIVTANGKGAAGLWFAYRFKVDRLYTPHLCVVEWPDDAQRKFQVHVMEGTTMLPGGFYWTRGGWARGEAAVICTDARPRSMKMHKLRFVYWPNEEDEAVHIFDLGRSEKPAAAASVTVYEIMNDLPALKIVEPAPPEAMKAEGAGVRLTGVHTERGPYTMSSTYYAGPLGRMFSYGWAGVQHPEFYRNWYTTTENMIKKMRFSGQNLYLMGHFMYWGVMYPSPTYVFNQNAYSGGDMAGDYISLMLRMFERNGMSLISGIEYWNTPDLIEASPATAEEVAQGAPTLFCVGKDGTFARPHGHKYGLNYFHPKVQDGILTIVGELADLYGTLPAWKGAAFMLSRAFGPIGHSGFRSEPLDWGYEDYTIKRFEEDTGNRIPVDSSDPERFGKRYEWLMAHARDQWVSWRCDQFTALYRRLRDRLTSVRPGLNLYLFCGEPLKGLRHLSGSASAAYDWGDYNDPDVMRGILRSFGFDADRLRKEDGIVISHFYLSPGTRQSDGVRVRDYQDIAHSEALHGVFADDGKGAAYIWSGFEEWHMAPGSSGATFEPGEWVFQVSDDGSQAYPWPPGAYLNDIFVNVLVRSNPTLLPHTWIDVNEPSGRVQEMRLFARAYRTLPNGKYRRLTGNGRDKNLWIETTTRDGVEYAYAANTQWWPLDKVTLTFAAGVKVHDLIRDAPVVLEDGTWTFTLGPYSLQTFRIEGGDAGSSAVSAAQARVPLQALTSLDRRIGQHRDLSGRAHARREELQRMPGWQGLAAVDRLTDSAAQLRRAGDFDQAYEVVTSWRLERARRVLVNEAMEAVPFLVLGPFGKPDDTEGAGKKQGNMEVVEGYRGMETPFLGEAAEGQPMDALRQGFRPDVNTSYKVYPDIERTWQEAVKTDALSFHGTCHSEPPLWMVAYAYTEVYSPVDRTARVLAGSDHALWIWVNDKRVLKHGGHGTHRGGQRGAAADQDAGTAQLHAGWNRVLVKAVQRGEARIFFRLTDAQGNGLDDLRFRVPKV